jgi:leader peptidase (prepilin peptidase) / N-methyltransferase
MPIPEPIILAVAAAFGAVLGSFLNVCIYRLPREGLTVSSPPRSHCTSCGFTIPWYDNIPILTWLLLGGRCRSCKAPISSRYLIVEALTATVFAVLADRYLLGPDPSPAVFAAIAVLASACIVVSFIDQDFQIIPDEISLPGLMAVPILSILIPGLHLPVGWPVGEVLAACRGFFEGAAVLVPGALRGDGAVAALVSLAAVACCSGGIGMYRLYWRVVHRESRRVRDAILAGILAGSAGGVLAVMILRPETVLSPRVASFWAALLGMAAGSGLVLAVGVVGRQVFRKEAMGFGDVKLMGLLGGFAGWSGAIAGFAIACFLGSVVGVYRLLRYRSRYLPFGPYLVIGTISMAVWPESFRRALSWYMTLFQ